MPHQTALADIHEGSLNKLCQHKASTVLGRRLEKAERLHCLYYVWFHITLHFMGIQKSTNVCNTKKEPTHDSMIAQRCVAILAL